MKTWLPATLIAVTLTGCGAHPGATLATSAVPTSFAPVAASGSVVLGPTTAPSVTLVRGIAASAAPATPADELAADVPGPGELTSMETAPSATPPAEVAPASLATLVQTDAAARAYAADSTSTSNYGGPVYLSPGTFPLIMPGHPAPLPAFSPRSVTGANLPTDAVTELARLGRLRQRKARWLSWLFGHGFPFIDAATAREMLATGQTIYLAPDGRRPHFASTYQPMTSVAPLDAMLPDLRQAALTKAQGEARDADITERMTLLPGFGGMFDVPQLLTLEPAISGYTYGGQPVHRALVTSYNLYAYASVRRAIATYWEDHPECTAATLRQAALSALLDKYRTIATEAGSVAAMPSAYVDARAIPGLREPRAVGSDGDTWDHDEDVQFNRNAIQDLITTAPMLLSATVYP